MEIRHLRYFVAVAEELNFTKAAAKLHLAQPSLTRQIKDLEAELGVALFDRLKNRISLTYGGRLFLRDARRLIAECAICVQAVQQVASSQSGNLDIGYIADSFPDLLPVTLRAFSQQFPQTELHLREMTAAEQYRALGENEIDLGFIDLRPEPNGFDLRCACVGQFPILAAISDRDPLAQSEQIPLRNLEPKFFAERSEKSFPGSRLRLIEVCRRAGFSPRILHQVESYPAMISVVARDLGVALMPQHQQRTLREAGVAFRPTEPRLTCNSYAIWRSDNQCQHLNRYLEILTTFGPKHCKNTEIVPAGGYESATF